MRVSVMTSFKADKREPLGDMLTRVHEAFRASGEAPGFQFMFADAPVAGFTSSVDRVLKRIPAMQRLLREQPAMLAGPVVRQLTNRNSDDTVDFATLHQIAAGIPKSFPFHSAQIALTRSDFGFEGQMLGGSTPGVVISDSWWVNGRNRSLSAFTVLIPEAGATALPPVPHSAEQVMAACGKVMNRVQVPLADAAPGVPGAIHTAQQQPSVVKAVSDVLMDYRQRLTEVVEGARLPHDLPPPDHTRGIRLGESTGPKKKVLLDVFKPLGYDCKAGSGTYELRRRTATNLTVEISIDVGTWSKSITATMVVHGLGFAARYPLPVGPNVVARQYPIEGPEQWRKIVENLGALVAELDRTLVPAIEGAGGETPAWYTPEDPM